MFRTIAQDEWRRINGDDIIGRKEITFSGSFAVTLEEENIVGEWLDHLKGLNVFTKKMFGCYCLYCDGQAVGWIHDSVLSLREVGLDYLPDEIKRPTPTDKIQELVIPLDYANSEWLPRAVQDTADLRRQKG